MKKSQAKAEEFYDKNPSVRTYTNEYTGKKIPTGPMTKKEYQEAAQRAADVYEEKTGPKLKKGGSMKKMKTGGMVNPNAKLQAAKSAGSKGVKPRVNPKAAASKVAKGRSGGTSAAPKTAIPKAKYGMSVKRK
jgi:glutamate 5-kinase